jgi:tRNA threonylcarbamoyladenosine biosynthesis protein TsaE
MVQAIVEGLGVAEPATSPTYSLVHRYQGRGGPVFHVDCYRLERPEEAGDLDWEGLARGAALLIAWPDRAGVWAARPSRRIELAHADDPHRRWVRVSR